MNHMISSRVKAQAQGVDSLVKSRYYTNDIIALITEVYQDHNHQAQPLAQQLIRSTINDTLKGVYTYVRANVRYIEDGDQKQLVPSPARMLQKGSGDCKGMSILVASILHHMGIPCYFRYAKYPKSSSPNQYSHIYVIVPVEDGKYIPVDPVYHTYGIEAPGSSAHKDVYCPASGAAIGGKIKDFLDKKADQIRKAAAAVKAAADQAADFAREKAAAAKAAADQAADFGRDLLDDVGDWTNEKRDDLEDWINDLNISQKYKTLVLTANRLAFLGVVRINVLGLADLINMPSNSSLSLALRNESRPKVYAILNKWYKWGGNRTELVKTAIQGSKEKALGVNLPIVRNWQFVKNLEASGVISGLPAGNHSIGEPGTVAASLTAASPFIVAIGGLLGPLALILSTFKKDNTNQNTDNPPPLPPPPTFFEQYKYELMGAAALGVALLIPSKKKK
jgi:hypothetical protein